MVERAGRPPRAAKPGRKAPPVDGPTAATAATAPKRARSTKAKPATARGAGGDAREATEAHDELDHDGERPSEPEEESAEDGEPSEEDGVHDLGAVIDLGGEEAAEAAEAGEAADGADHEAEAEAEVVEDSDDEPDLLGRERPARRGKRDRDEGRVGLIKRDPMQAYMQEVRRYPLLTPEEEHSLATRLVEHGDTTAARRLVEANLRLVVKIAYEYRRAHRNLLDLVQEGNIGLIQAVGKFDPGRGVKLSSYAAFWIRAYILKFILNNWRLVKIGTTQAQRKLFFNLRKERERLEQLGFYPSAKLLAENLDVTEKEVVEMERRLAAPEASLDAPVQGDEDGARTRLDFVPSEETRPDQAVADTEFAALFNAKLDAFQSTLAGREADIFKARWRTEPPMTLQELGDKYGVSRERARQLEKRVLDRLKKFIQAELGTEINIDALSRE
ncbi:MAG TPA: RNA polymerase factor sigma-32 [Kofleriaceae bacterium]|nr:RNA polymerase factor sigma-32 [Kofleriaceae bacterium]